MKKTIVSPAKLVAGVTIVLFMTVAASFTKPQDTRNLTPVQAKMFPRQHAFAPTVHQLHRNGRLFPPNYLHDSWLDYLYWDTELDP